MIVPAAGAVSTVNETVSVVAKSSGPIGVPSGLVPKANALAASAGRNARSGTVASTGVDPRATSVPAGAGAPRPAGACRVTTRALRQITTGVTPGLGLMLVNVR